MSEFENRKRKKTKTSHLVYGLETPIVQLCSHLQTIKQPAAQPRLGFYCATINHKPSIIDIKTDLCAPWRVCVQTRLLTHLWVNFISPPMQNPIFIWIWNISGYPIDITCIFKDWFLSHLEAHFRPTLCLRTYVSTILIRKWIVHVRMESHSCVFRHLGSFLWVSETKTVQPSPSSGSSTCTLYINNVRVETVSVSVLPLGLSLEESTDKEQFIAHITEGDPAGEGFPD